MEEIWRDILGYEGKYQVSNLGRVKSVEAVWKVKGIRRNDNRRRDEQWIRHERILKSVSPGKTEVVHLYSGGGKRINIAVKRLVAQAFLGVSATIKTNRIHLIDPNKGCGVNNIRIDESL